MRLGNKKILIIICLGLISFKSSKMIYSIKDGDNNSSFSKNNFAVVELFTSEGCSSCPPADALVTKLLEEYKENVYVLGFHVDYWNNLGWKDNYSQAEFSRRQEQYGNFFKLNSIYTPQIIVNGETEFVGSDQIKLKNAVKAALLKSAETKIQLSAYRKGEKVYIDYKTYALPESKINVALIQLHTATNVRDGENKGRILQHVNVVRDFKTTELKQLSGSFQFLLPENFQGSGYKVIAFIQASTSWEIIAATEASIDE